MQYEAHERPNQPEVLGSSPITRFAQDKAHLSLCRVLVLSLEVLGMFMLGGCYYPAIRSNTGTCIDCGSHSYTGTSEVETSDRIEGSYGPARYATPRVIYFSYSHTSAPRSWNLNMRHRPGPISWHAPARAPHMPLRLRFARGVRHR